MKNFKVLTVVGARPQFIKAAPLSTALKNHPFLTEILVHTGQHYDYKMSQRFFEELGLPQPHYNLETGSGRHLQQMAHILIKLDEILTIEKPDIVVVFGDTNSTAAAAIAAAKNHIALAHVEAGLREFNKNVPEEINKLLTDAVTDLYFAPTQTGVDILEKMNITKNVYLTGDIGIDLIFNNLDKISENKKILQNYQDTEGGYFFVTCHRAANTDSRERLEQILLAIADLKKTVIFPIHPRTKAKIEEYGLSHLIKKPHIHCIEPVGFWDTQTYIRYADIVLTDSGGVIKEAYFHKTPCIIMDSQIEWVEAVNEGWARLENADYQRISAAVSDFGTPQEPSDFLGNGTAALQIVEAIHRYLS